MDNATSSAISEEGSISKDVSKQAENLQKGLTAMPLDVAADSVSRWKDTLSSLGDPKLTAIAGRLGDLHKQLTGGSPDGAKIGPVLSDLGRHVDTVASGQSGALQTALKSLSGALTQGGSSLK